MIVPVRFRSKKEIEEINKKIREMSRSDMYNMFLKKGWSPKSAMILTDAMKEGVKQK
jgi:hypothetical protein